MKIKRKLKLITLFLFICGCLYAQKKPIDYVNPFIGTGFHGHTYPGATVPFGAVQLSPDTRKGNWDACSGYHYDDSSIIGFSHTHLSGTGCIDLGDILFHPTTQKIEQTSEKNLYCPLQFSHNDEIAHPGYYSVEFKQEQIKAELTATRYVGVHRYSFPKKSKASIIIDLLHSLDNEYIYEAQMSKTSGNEIVGMRSTRGWVDHQHIYFVAQFSKPIQSLSLVKNGHFSSTDIQVEGQNIQAVTEFNVADGLPVIVKVAISLVSIDNARANLKNDVADFDFDKVKSMAQNEWNQALNEITVDGGTDEELTNFYTSVYHSKVMPNIVSDVNGQYRGHDNKISTLARGEKQYSTFSIWDTFRAWHPLVTLTNTQMVSDMINSFLNIYDASGELPIWPLSSGETGTMIGYHSVSVIADAYMKGIRGFDAEKALKAMIVSSEKNKKGADYYIKNGFIPSNIKKESISCLLEFAYDDWAIAQMAKAMKKNDVYNKYIKRSQSYVNVFDGATKFFRGKRIDGNWDSPFNSFEVGRAYTEATAWQYRFFVPHDVNGMMQLYGGKDAFIKELDNLFIANSGVHGDMPDITGLIGQYAHGNEPSHHMAYLYNYVGQPWKTQEKVRHILTEMYKPTPGGIVGNEDCGQMSAWYILSSLGLYSVCPASNEYVLCSPLFKNAVIHLANGKTLKIRSNSTAENKYIKSVLLNGKELKTNYITYKQIMNGGELSFTLASTPNLKRGISLTDFPYSYSKGEIVSIPYVDKDLDLFQDRIHVQLKSATPNATIRYTLDGSEPTITSKIYGAPFCVDKTTVIKARAFKKNYLPSAIMIIQARKAELREPSMNHPKTHGCSFAYYEGLYKTIADITKSKLVKSGTMPEPTISNSPKEDHFAYIFEGMIYVPQSGVYEFQTRSDDGSLLFIDDEKVVDNDGSHAAIISTGRIALKSGYHSYKLCYFEDYEGEHLSWSWKLPSSNSFTAIPLDNLYLK